MFGCSFNLFSFLETKPDINERLIYMCEQICASSNTIKYLPCRMVCVCPDWSKTYANWDVFFTPYYTKPTHSKKKVLKITITQYSKYSVNSNAV